MRSVERERHADKAHVFQMGAEQFIVHDRVRDDWQRLPIAGQI